ncbi:MAG: hypothetical protein RR797_07280 [Christensenella sp.]
MNEEGGKYIMVSLVIAIIAAVCVALSFCPALGLGVLSIVGFILAIVAWIMGGKAVKADSSDKKAKIGKILGMIITILSVVAIILFIIAMATVAGIVVGAAM